MLGTLSTGMASLLEHQQWCVRATGLEALELLDAEALLNAAELLLRTLPALDWTLSQARSATPPTPLQHAHLYPLQHRQQPTSYLDLCECA